MNLLVVQNVSVNFGGLKALDEVSICVRKGSIAALIGPNGAGKTTLFNVITGMIEPTQGTVEINGQEIQGKATHKMVHFGVSRTFQNIRLIPEMSVLENVLLGYHTRMKQNLLDSLFYTRRFRKEERENVDKAKILLDFVGLSSYIHERAKNLPYGLQRLLEIARILAADTELIMLDEPCAGLNTGEKGLMSKLIRSINDQFKKTILLIEHDMRFVMNLAEEITVLDQGNLIATGVPSEIQKNEQVIAAYLGRKRKEK